MIGAETAQNHDLIQGICFIKGNNLNIMFQTQLIHSSLMIVSNTLNCQTPFLDTSLVISTYTSKSITTNKVCPNCPLFIENMKFLVNLICITLL